MKAALLVLVAMAAPAAADPPGLTPAALPADSYRLQIGIADATGLVLIAATAERQDKSLELAIATYVLAAPAVYVLHDRPMRALASAGLHLGVPLVGILVGVGIGGGNRPADADDNGAAILGGVIGAAAGLAIASVIDVAVLAKPDEPARVVPLAAPTQNGGMTFGVAGAF